MTVLVVDDLPADRRLLMTALEEGGISVLEASNGVEALSVLGSQKVDAIVSDILMPKMDGYELCAKTRESGTHRGIPFLFHSGSFTSQTDEKFAREIGADGFFQKPASAEAVVSMIRSLENRSRAVPSTTPRTAKEARRHYKDRLVSRIEERTTELRDLNIRLEKLSRAIEQTGDSVVITDSNGSIQYVNSSFERITGFTKKEVTGKNPRILKSGKMGISFYKRMWDTILAGKTFRGTFVNRKKNGELYFEDKTITPLSDEQGQIVSFISTGRDITEHRHAEEELRESERRFREMLQNVELIAMTLDVNAIVTFCNDYLLKVTARERSEVIGRNWFELFIPGDNEQLKDAFAALLKNDRRVWHYENEILTRSGERRLIRWNNTVLRSPSGEITGTASIGEDITERRKAAARLESERVLLRTIVDTIPDEIAIKDTERRFLLANPGVAKAIGLSSTDEIIGKRDEDLIPTAEVGGLIEEETNILRSGSAIINKQPRERLNRQTGRIERAILTTKLPLRDASGAISGLVVINRDVTELKRSAQLLDVFSQLGRKLNSARSPEDAARIVATTAEELFTWDSCAIDLLSPVEGTINSILNVEKISGQKKEMKVLLAGRKPSARERRILERGKEVITDGNGEEQTGPALMGAPIRAGGKVIGILFIQSQSPSAYGEADLETLQSLADYCGGALERLRSVQDLEKNERRLASIYETVGDIIFHLAVEGPGLYRFISVNKAFLQTTGMEANQVVGKPVTEVIPRPSLEMVMGKYREAIETKGIIRWEETTAYPLGALTGEVSVAPVFDDEGNCTNLVGAVHDITKRKRAELELEEALAYSRTVIEKSPIGIITYDNSGNAVTANEAVARMVGGSRNQLMKQNFRRLESWKRSGLTEKADEALRSAKEQEFEAEITTTFGKHLWLSCHLVPFEYGGEKHLLAHFIDVTDRKNAQEALKESEERFRKIYETSPVGIATVNNEGRFLSVNQTMERIVGYTEEELRTKTFTDITYTEDREVGLQELRNLVSGKAQIAQFEKRYTRKDGALVWAHLTIAAIRDEEGRLLTTVSMVEDITERKKAEDALRLQTSYLRQLFNNSPVGIVLTDLETHIVDANGAFLSMFQFTLAEVKGKRTQHVFLTPENQSESEQILHEILDRRTVLSETKRRRRDGSLIDVQLIAFPVVANEKVIALYGIYVDLTERKRVEEQLLRSQRLESVGTLAGGIAHDLNNALGPILLSIDVLRRYVKDERALKLLKTVEDSSKRGSEMIKQILTFARGVGGEFNIVQTKHVIKEAFQFVRETFPKNIELKLDLEKDLWPIVGDATRIHQVIMNLCVNARDAMPDGGTLAVTAKNMVIDQAYAQTQIDARPGPYIVFRVSDTGTGIPEHLWRKIFDPFFTTKEPGKGTGLGLATVTSIIKSHQGFIEFSSKVGSGTEFKVCLPAQPIQEVPAEPGLNPEILSGQGELILIIDDEEAVREIMKQTVETFGYKVLLAADGAEGVAQFALEKDAVAAVITDMAMPVMDGKTTIRALRSMSPQVKIIAASGQVDSLSATQLAELGVRKSLSKPFTAADLMRTLYELLHEQPDATVPGAPASNPQ